MLLRQAFLCPRCGRISSYIYEYGSGSFRCLVKHRPDGLLSYEHYEMFGVRKVSVVLPCDHEYRGYTATAFSIKFLQFNALRVIYDCSSFLKVSFGKFGYFWCMR